MLLVERSVEGQLPAAPAYLQVEHSSPDAPEYDDFWCFSLYFLLFMKTPTQMTTTTRTAAVIAAPMSSFVEDGSEEVSAVFVSSISVVSIAKKSLLGRVLKIAQEFGPFVLMQSLYSRDGCRFSYLK